MIKLFFDGGYRAALGHMETAVVARGILHHRSSLGPGSSEQAEWLALLDALRTARELGAEDALLLGDSASVMNQVGGTARCRVDTHRACLAAFHDQRQAFARLRLRHVPRTQNLAGIALARMRDGAAGPV